MKILALLKCEFLKNYSIKKTILFFVVLLLSSILLVEMNHFLGNVNYNETIEERIKQYQNNIVYYEEKVRDNNSVSLQKIGLEQYQFLSTLYPESTKITSSWLGTLTDEIIEAKQENYVIQSLEGSKDFQTVCERNSHNIETEYESYLYGLCEKTTEEIQTIEEENNKLIEENTSLLKEKKYYLYLQENIQKNQTSGQYYSKDQLAFAQLLIDKKIESEEDYHVQNYKWYSYLDVWANGNILTEKEFQETKEEGIYMEFDTYEKYKQYQKDIQKEAIQKSAILLYSTTHNIPTDLSYSLKIKEGTDNNSVQNTKTSVHQIFNLSIVVMILVSITSSGSMSKEHSKGTIKNMVTTPVKRYKILLSKFLYLILHTYILWLIGLFCICFYAGIKYGFQDLFTPKLIYQSGKVFEVNYFLYLIKEMLLAGIPIISFLSTLFLLSTILLNTVITTSITTMLPLFSCLSLFICYKLHLKFILYLPSTYYNMSPIFFHEDYYMHVKTLYNINFELAIFVSLIAIFINLLLTNFIYIKRDIKN